MRAFARLNARTPHHRRRRPGDDMNDIAVFVQTNDARGNELVAFTRDADGRLTNAGSCPTGGRGTGKPHLPSQGSIAVDADGAHLIVVNAGSDELSNFCLDAERVSPSVKNGHSEVCWTIASGTRLAAPTAASSMRSTPMRNASSRIAWRTRGRPEPLGSANAPPGTVAGLAAV